MSNASPRLSSLDLNLLVALDALLRERSVTSAGRRIGLSQPAMSHALSRLRELLGDPILAREGRVMRHTALAERLAPQVRRLLGEIEATLLGHRAFVPARAAHVPRRDERSLRRRARPRGARAHPRRGAARRARAARAPRRSAGARARAR
ncbi:Transcriptional regulator, LysR family protein [Sandaracinus amylolyticus]|uniref:Transcriptional regulator, LysR family protein n=2 Tax=Sandaracinus amylolyticus TaxID=927083 RepID=A0A0F6W7X3_9BACT|nr:Transcriptional regulator, LysR family protein [Sandaracinus amylolyticus]